MGWPSLHMPRLASGGQRPLACVAAVLAVAFACLGAPAESFAYFNQVDDKNSAQQDIGTYGDVIAASEIPAGTYTITARTSSRMCVFYDTALDAATRSENKELCTLSVGGGSMTATFYMTAAYTHIYMGTGEQAARLTDDEGTDDSAYVRGEAVPVTTPSGTVNAYRYTMAVSELDSPVVFASYDGGSAGVANGKWFNREVVFMPSDEVVKAMAQDGRPSEGSEAEEPAPGAGSSSAAEPAAQGDGEDGEGAPSSQPEGAEAEEAPASTATRNAPAAGLAAGAGQAADNAGTEPEAPREPSEAGAAGADAKARAALISPAATGSQANADEAEVVAAASEAAEKSSPAFALAIMAAGIALAGALVRTVVFAVEKGGRS